MVLKKKSRKSSDLSDLEEIGFSDADLAVLRRLIINVEGFNKTGKTNFALGAPGPLAVFDIDIGLEGVVHKFASPSKRILRKGYALKLDMEDDADRIQKVASEVWGDFRSDFGKVCANTSVRSIVWDSGSEVWELARLAEFGRLAQIQPWHYVQLNSEFRKVLRLAVEAEKNFIVTHKLTEIYQEVTGPTGKRQGKPTGEYRRAGFKDMQYVVQINLRSFRDDEGFGIEILDCRQDGDLGGMILRKKACSFTHLATTLFPETEPKDWR